MTVNSQRALMRLLVMLCSAGAIVCSSKPTQMIPDNAMRFADDPTNGWNYNRYLVGLHAVYHVESDTIPYPNPLWADTCLTHDCQGMGPTLMFSHHIPTDVSGNPIKTKIYCENIGKYDQFAIGWTDFKNGQPITSPQDTIGVNFMTPNRTEYLGLWRF